MKVVWKATAKEFLLVGSSETMMDALMVSSLVEKLVDTLVEDLEAQKVLLTE